MPSSLQDQSLVPLFLDEDCEGTSLSTSIFSLHVLPLVPPLLDGGSSAARLYQHLESTCVPMNPCSSLVEHYETSLSASKLLQQVLPLVAHSLDDESQSTEPYRDSHATEEAHRAPQGADVDQNASVDEEIAPDGNTGTFNAIINTQVS